MWEIWAKSQSIDNLIIYAFSDLEISLDTKVDASRKELIIRKYIDYPYYIDDDWIEKEEIDTLKLYARNGPVDFGKDIKTDLAKLKLIEINCKW